jgi:hypothetical protein
MRPTSPVAVSRWLALLALLIAAVPARAGDDYAGTWAYDLTQCKAAQDTSDAPMIITKGGYDQHETHCAFKSVEGAGPDWKVKADCTVEGDSQLVDLSLTVSGDTLTVGDEGGTRDLLRCK